MAASAYALLPKRKNDATLRGGHGCPLRFF
jgi:hypothetical protein